MMRSGASEPYVLPSLDGHDNGFGSPSMFSPWTTSGGTTRPSSSHEQRIASPTRLAPSRPAPGAPPSSYRSPTPSAGRGGEERLVFQRDFGASSPLPPAPILQQRRSSLSLDAKLRPKLSGNFFNKNLPSTPISATPSLTFSHSRAGSRSDDDAFSSPAISPAHPEHRGGGLRSSSQGNGVYGKGRNAASVGNLKHDTRWKEREEGLPTQDDSFLPHPNEGLGWAPTADGMGSVRSRKTTIEFQQKGQRNPDKIAHLLGEEYQEAQRSASERGQQLRLDGNTSSLSLASSKSGFKGFFSTMRGRKKREEEEYDPDESNWERERRMEEKKKQEERKKQLAMERTMDLLSEFSLDRAVSPQKAAVTKAKKETAPSGSNESISRRKVWNRGENDDGGASHSGAYPPSPSTSFAIRHGEPRPGARSTPLFNYGQHFLDKRHRSQLSTDSSTLVGSSRNVQRIQRRNSTASIADGSFLRMDTGANSSSSDSHSRTPSDLSSISNSSLSNQPHESFLALSSRVSKPQSANVPSVEEEQAARAQQEKEREALLFPAALPVVKGQSALGQGNGQARPSTSQQSIPSSTLWVQEQDDEPDCRTPRGVPAQLEADSRDMIPTVLEPRNQPRLLAPNTPLPPVFPSLMVRQERQQEAAAAAAATSTMTMYADQLAPLTDLLDDCMTAKRREPVWPWGSEKERGKLLSATSSKDAVPKSWAGYVRAYAKGDFDLNNPPAPRSAPLVKKAIPRSSPSIGSSPSMTSLYPPSPSSPQSVRLKGKRSGGSLGSYRDFSSSSRDLSTSHIPNLPPTPPLHSSLRDRRPSPRFGIGRSRSREVIHENMKLPRDDPDDIRLQAEELAAVGGMGDIRGPRPAWEVERNASAKEFIDPLARQANPRLTSMMEKLAERLKVSYAGTQILLGEETILLASSGLDEGARMSLDVFSTPRLDSFDDDGGEEREKVLSRDRTLDAHTILQRDGTPLVIPDLTLDWRFDCREAADVRFYAGASIFSPDSGLPIGTVSVMHDEAREWTREQMETLTDMAREVEQQLDRSRREALKEKLQGMDDGMLAWVKSVQTATPISPLLRSPPPTPPSPSSASQLAERRGARKPAPIDTSQTLAPLSSSGVLAKRLAGALEAICATLGVELAYIARVGSDPLQCSIEAKRQAGVFEAGELSPEAAMHLCALAAPKRGLQFAQDRDQVRQLLGEEVRDENEAAGLPPFVSALVVGCGLKEGGKAHRGTEGWVLCVATRASQPLQLEANAYLRKFASLLGPILLQGPRSPQLRTVGPSQPTTKSPRTPLASRSLSVSPTTPVFITPRSSPLSQSFASKSKELPPRPALGKKKLPLASPPPSAPLPLPPVSPLYASASSPIRMNSYHGRPRAFSDLRYSASVATSVSHNEDVEVLDSDDGHFEHETIGRGESPLGVVHP